MKKFLKTLIKDERGVSILEYGLFVALISFAAILSLQAIGLSLSKVFTLAANAINATLGGG